ncbi:unnamed protein product [Ambrosiozyma monospora]|uniref:Unnamed protein product n=1 Tax=Ambrosiozyma monospora TaxID=43982 RepID=A0A9W7DGV3_AMBMO|nr:unnamed protein product [Ambrosiozyma monospora]
MMSKYEQPLDQDEEVITILSIHTAKSHTSSSASASSSHASSPSNSTSPILTKIKSLFPHHKLVAINEVRLTSSRLGDEIISVFMAKITNNPLWIQYKGEIYPTCHIAQSMALPLVLNDVPTIMKEIQDGNWKFNHVIPKTFKDDLIAKGTGLGHDTILGSPLNVVGIADITDSRKIVAVGKITDEPVEINGLPGVFKLEVEIVHMKNDFTSVLNEMNNRFVADTLCRELAEDESSYVVKRKVIKQF